MSRKRALTDLISQVSAESALFCEQSAYDVMLKILLMMEISDSFMFKGDIIRDTRQGFEKDQCRWELVLLYEQIMNLGGKFRER